MEFRYQILVNFLLLSCSLILSKVYFVNASDVKVEYFHKASFLLGKSAVEAEMAFLTQFFFFVNEQEEFGNSMLNILRKYLDMRNGNEVFPSRHWKFNNPMQDSNYKNRSYFCKNYLSDDVLLNSGIKYNPDLSKVIENNFIIAYNYYTRDKIQMSILQCPVILYNLHFSNLYFVRFKYNHNPKKSTYFVLASKFDATSSDLNILMYRHGMNQKKKEEIMKSSQVSLMTIAEEESKSEDKEQTAEYEKDKRKEKIEDESEVAEIKLTGPINFHKILKVPPPQYDGDQTNDQIVLFGKDAERVFIASASFAYINLHAGGWIADKFIQLIENMRRGNKIRMVTENKNENSQEAKSYNCIHYIRDNLALKLRKIVPNIEELSKKINIVYKPTIFPRAKFPQVNFQFPMLMCPALFGDDKKKGTVYIEIVSFYNKNDFSTAFSLLESKSTPGSVYPATLSTVSKDFVQLSANVIDDIPSIEEETAPAAEESIAESSTNT